MNLNTEICRLFHIEYPIIQAGMAGGVTTPELVAAVSNAGGLGVLGAGYLTPETMNEEIQKVRALTNKPFAVNIFKVEMAASDRRTRLMHENYQSVYEELDLVIEKEEEITAADYYKEQFDLLVKEEVPIISTTFGVPSADEIERAHSKGILVMTMITTVKEALEAEQAGVNVVVAQGSEAGGHRGTFDVSESPQGALVGTMALVPQVVDRVSIPVIAAGGIMDGRGLVASLALGAEGVQLGSRFLHTFESGTDNEYKKALVEGTEDSTIITSCFSGRPARAIQNPFTDFHLKQQIKPLDYPIQNLVTNRIRKAAKEKGKREYLSLWAGQGIGFIKAGQTAEEVIVEMMEQARRMLERA
jgi:nitronate monooxygenase